MEPTPAEEKFSSTVDNFVRRQGYQTINWARLCFNLTIIYTILNLFAGLYHADFMNMTVCCLAIYMLSNPDIVDKTSFRLLVAGTIISLLYDFIWHFMQSSEADEASESGMAGSIRTFTYWI
jgi:hypothetical protein